MWCFVGFILHAIAGVWGANALWMAMTREGGFLPGLAVAIFSPLIALVCGLGGARSGYLVLRDQTAGAAAITCAVTVLVVLGVCFFVNRG
ncbi:MAG: hypothetical protein JWP72_1390 [Massilia sp.]|nr:hypothetical protein [Massilia sp.]